MPELPEVETIRRQLAPVVSGRTIEHATAHGSAKFVEALDVIGAKIEDVKRRGKYLLFGLQDDRELIVHLGMTGQLLPTKQPQPDDSATNDSPANEYVRAAWDFDDGSALLYRDVRRFGRIRVVDVGDYATIATLDQLGPEPFDNAFTPTHLHAAIKRSTRRLKTQLLSQRPVAGLGNIYADEALWQAQVYPAARTLSMPAAKRLHQAIVEVLQAAIANGGTTLRDYRNALGDAGENQFHLQCYGRGGEGCLRCANPLRSRVWDARTTTWCPTCQPR